jgi:hypothetical protein
MNKTQILNLIDQIIEVETQKDLEFLRANDGKFGGMKVGESFTLHYLKMSREAIEQNLVDKCSCMS